MKKNTVLMMIIVAMISVLLMGMNPISQPAELLPAGDTVVSDESKGWENPHKVTFIADGVTYLTNLIEEGQSFGEALPDAPEKGDGYTWKGWLIGGDEYLKADTLVNSDLTVTADFEESYPARTVSGTVNGISVEINIPENSLPVSAKLTLSAVSMNKETINLVKDTLNKGELSLSRAVHLSFVDSNGKTILPNKAVTVKMQVTDLGTANVLYVVELGDDGDNSLVEQGAPDKTFTFSTETYGTFVVTYPFADRTKFDDDSDFSGKGALVVVTKNSGNGYDGYYAMQAEAASNNGLKRVPLDSDEDITVWTITKAPTSENDPAQPKFNKWAQDIYGYYVQADNGKYLSVTSSGVTLSDTAVIVGIWSSRKGDDNNISGAFGIVQFVYANPAQVQLGEDQFAQRNMGYNDKDFFIMMDAPEKAAVTFDTNGGDGVAAAKKALVGSIITLPTSAGTKSGYEFMGWAESEDAEKAAYLPGSTYTVEGDVTFYAVWQSNKYASVRFYRNDDTNTLVSSFAFEIEKIEKIAFPSEDKIGTRENLKFAGWSTNKDAETPDEGFEAGAASMTAPMNDLDLYAVWYEKVTVTFAAEDAVVTPASFTDFPGVVIKLSDYTVTNNEGNNNEFSHWDDGKTVYTADSEYTLPLKDITLEAVWNAPKYTVSFSANGGKANVLPDPVRLTKGSVFTVPAFDGSRDGYEFLGWIEYDNYGKNVIINGTGTYYKTTYKPGDTYQLEQEKDVTLYAHWGKSYQENVGVKYSLRWDGIIPNEPAGFPVSEYSTTKFGYDAWDVDNPGNVYKWGVLSHEEWVVDLDTSETNLVGSYYKENAVTLAVDNNVPSADEVVRMSGGTFDPEKQFVVWYVLKFQNNSAREFAKPGDSNCPDSNHVDSLGYCLNSNNQRIGSNAEGSKNGLRIWQIDGVIVNKDQVWVTYETGLPVKVDNMPANYSLYIQQDQQDQPIAQTVPVGSTKIKNGSFVSYEPKTDGYVFLGWMVKGGDGILYKQGDSYSVTKDVTFVAQWRPISKINSGVLKIWKDDSGYGVRPDGIQVTLWQRVNGKDTKTGISATLTADGSWSYTVPNLPQYNSETADGGVPIQYFWREDTVPELYEAPSYVDSNNSTTITNTFVPVTELAVEKTADKTSGWELGQTVTYTITVKNNGNLKISDLGLVDELAGINLGSLNKTTLAAGETAFATATYVVTQADVDKGEIYNKVTVTGVDPKGQIVTDEDDETVTTFAANGELTVKKTADPVSGVKAGDTVTYTVVVTNSGNLTISGIELTDTLVDLNEAAFDLTPGESKTVNYEYTVKQADVDNGKINNTAVAEGTDSRGNKVSDSDSAEVTTVTPKPGLSVEKTGEPQTGVKAGESITYKVVVTNTGNVTINSIEMTDTLVSLDDVELFDLVPGTSKEITYTYTVTQTDVNKGSIVNVATVAGKDPSGEEITAEDNETVTTEPADAALTVEKSASPQYGVGVGSTITYTVKVTNSGNVTVSEIKLADSLVSLNQEDFTLNPGESTTVTYTYIVTQADVDEGKIDNTAIATGKDPNGDPVSGSDSKEVTTEDPNPELTVIKTASPESGVDVADIVTYTVEITNSGNVTLHEIALSDTLVDLSVEPFDLAPGAVYTVSYTYQVTQDDVDDGQIDNTVIAAGVDPHGTEISGQDDETVSTLRNPGLTVSKTSTQKDGYKLGDIVTYTIVVTNTGNMTLRDIDVIDDLTGSHWTIDILLPGMNTSLNDYYEVKAADVVAGQIVNFASAEGNTPDDQKVNGRDDETVTTEKIALVIRAVSDEKIYDGTALTNDGYIHVSGDLAEGNSIQSVNVNGSQTNYGSSANVASDAVIVNHNNEDVTAAYEISYEEGTLTVNRRPVTVVADNWTKVYGDPDPELTAKVEGLVGDDSVEYTVSREAGEDQGYYAITPAGEEVQGNYTVTYRTGTLEISPRPLTITADSAEKVYDGTALEKNSYTQTGLIEGDSIDSVTINGSITNVGTETNVAEHDAVIINAYGRDVTGNYLITYNDGSLKVNPKAVVVKAEDKSKTYGESDPELTASVSGLLDGDNVEYTLNREEGENIGTYAIIPSGDAVQGNYTVTYENGVLTINPRPLTITADSDTKVYDGTPLVKDSYTNAALAVGDNFDSVTVTGSQTVVGSSANVASNAVIVRDGVDVTENYVITYEPGELIVTQNLAVIITAGSSRKTYDGTALTDNSWTVAGLAAGDHVESVGVTGEQTDAGSSENVPSAARIVNGAGTDVTASYAITYVNGMLTVDPKPLTIIADSDTKTYDGTALVKESYTNTDLVDGDSIDSVTVSGSQTVAGSSMNKASDAVITNANGDDVTANYTITYADGTLTVTKRPVTVTADSDTKVYDGIALTRDSAAATDLAAGDELVSVVVTGSQTVVGKSDNVPTNARISNAAGEDVTDSYEISYANGSLKVTPKSVTITADSDTKVYDGTALTRSSYTSTALAEGDRFRSVTITGSQTVVGSSDNTPSAAQIVNAAGQNVTGSYAVGYEKGTLTVTPKTVVVTADSASKVYDGTALTKDGYTSTDLAAGDSFAAVAVSGSQILVGSSDNVASDARIMNAAGQDVTASYTISYVNGTLTVGPREVVVTAASDEKVYSGTALTNSGYTVTGLTGDDTIGSVVVSGQQTVVGSAVNVAGDAKVVDANGNDVTANYTIRYESGTLTVTPRPVVITADSDSKIYDGTPLTKDSYTSDGLATGDSVSSVSVQGSQTMVGVSDNIASSAHIINRNGDDVTSSYTISYVRGKLEVTQKVVTIIADSDEKIYDGTALTIRTFTNTALANGDNIEAVTVSGEQTEVGTSANVPGSAKIVNASGVDVTASYGITYVNGNLNVTPRTVTVTADSDAKVYDGTALVKNSYTNTALAGEDRIISVTVTGEQVNAGISDNVPSAARIVNAAGEDVTKNYNVIYANGTLEVIPMALTITADSDTKVYDGTALTDDAYTNSGVAEGDSIASVSVTGSQIVAGSSDNVPSDARIVNAAGADVTGNYVITYVDGNLTVTKKPLTIKANSDTKVYDGIVLTNSGFSSGETAAGDSVVSAAVNGSQTLAGSSANTVSGAAIRNSANEDVTSSYDIVYVDGTLEITPKPLTITASSGSKIYDGTPLVVESYSNTELVEDDRIDNVIISGSQTNVGSSYNEASNAGIVNAAGEDVTSSYDITYNRGLLEVTTAPSLIITAVSDTKVYDGMALVNGGYTYTGLAAGDQLLSVVVRGSRTNVGTAPNVPSAAIIINAMGEDVTANYNITYVPGTLVVTPKSITISAGSNSKVYDGTPLTEDSFTTSGTAEGDTVDSVNVKGEQTNAGISDNIPSDAVILNANGEDVTANYQITYTVGELSVSRKPLTINAEGGTKVYDGSALIIDAYTAGDLAADDHIESVIVRGSQTNVGSNENVPSNAVIINAEGEVVTGNYEIVYVEGELTVTSKPIIITAGSAHKVYDGTALVNDAYTVTDLAGNDSLTSVTVTGSRTNVGESPNVASDAVILNARGIDVTGNYDIQYVDGALTVTPKTVYVTGEDKTKEFGQNDQPLTAVVTGTLNGDTVEYTITREAGEEPGNYPIVPAGETEQGNYIVVYVPADMVITYNPTSATVVKVWVDDNNRDGIRPVSLGVTLVGSDGSSRRSRLSDANGWTVTIDDLPVYANGSPIIYSWTEEDIEGYTLTTSVSNDATVLTNTHEISRTSVSVNKIWDDMDNATGARPASLSVRLMSNGTPILSASLNEANGWSATVNNLPVNENGSPIDYTWSEQSVSGYYPVSSTRAGYNTTFTNSNLFKLTIHYRYSNGDTAHEDYVASQPVGYIFSVASPEIRGYIASIQNITGEQVARDMEFTVIYSTDGTVNATPNPTATPVPTVDTPVKPSEEPEPQKDVPEPRVSEPDEEHPLVVAEPNILVDIDDLETALGLGEVFINNGGYALE